MIEIERAGGWYCDGKVKDRRYAILMTDQYIETDYGNVPLSPGSNSLFLRLSKQLRFAGSGHTDPNVWEWSGISWINQGPYHGNHPVIYDNYDNLIINHDTNLATGFRFVRPDNSIATSDETYGDIKRQIYEYTEIGNVTIGQGKDGGMLALHEGKRYRIAEGNVRMINVDRLGDEFCISWWTHPSGSSTFTTAHVRWMSLAEIQTFPQEFLPKAVLEYSLDKTEASAPAVITGTITKKENVRDFRWMKDGIIDKPDDPVIHKYQFYLPGKHSTSLHAQAWDDSIFDTPEQTVNIAPAEPRILLPHGLNAWMPGNNDLVDRLMRLNWNCYRGDVMSMPNFASQIEEVWNWGAEALVIITPGQVKDCPPTANVEVMDCDRMANGKPPFPEPNLRGVNPITYAETINSIVPIAKELNLTVWAGASNMDAYAWWRAFAANLNPYVGLSPHRYPRDARKVTNPQIGATDREDEIRKWKAAVGNRPFIVSEFGYHTGRCMKWSGDVWKGLSKVPFLTSLLTYKLTDQQVAEFVKWEFAYWERHGATAAFLYQLNDAKPGVGEEGNTPFGIRRYNVINSYDWKPVAKIWV